MVSRDRVVEEVFEEGEAPNQAQTIHCICANIRSRLRETPMLKR